MIRDEKIDKEYLRKHRFYDTFLHFDVDNFELAQIFVHQFLVQSIEFFKFDRFFEVMLNILVTSIISIIFVLIYTLAFKIKEKV